MSERPPRPVSIVLGVIRAVLGALILAGVGINFANVVGRYVFLKPIIWAEEVLVFIMVWCVMLGATLVTWENQHLILKTVTETRDAMVFSIAMVSKLSSA